MLLPSPQSFGFAPGVRPEFVGMVLFQMMVGPLDEVINFGLHVLSRTFEFQADRFAVRGQCVLGQLLLCEQGAARVHAGCSYFTVPSFMWRNCAFAHIHDDYACACYLVLS